MVATIQLDNYFCRQQMRPQKYERPKGNALEEGTEVGEDVLPVTARIGKDGAAVAR